MRAGHIGKRHCACQLACMWRSMAATLWSVVTRERLSANRDGSHQQACRTQRFTSARLQDTLQPRRFASPHSQHTQTRRCVWRSMAAKLWSVVTRERLSANCDASRQRVCRKLITPLFMSARGRTAWARFWGGRNTSLGVVDEFVEVQQCWTKAIRSALLLQSHPPE